MDEVTTGIVTGQDHHRPVSLFDPELSGIEEIDSPASTLEASEPYQSALADEQRWSGYQDVPHERPFAHRARRAVTWVDLLSPFTGYISALSLTWVSSPEQQPVINQAGRWLAWTWLIAGLLAVLRKQLRARFLARKPAGNRFTRRAARIVLNHFSRQGNDFWRLTAPFWLLLIGNEVFLLGSGILDQMEMIYGFLTLSNPTPPPRMGVVYPLLPGSSPPTIRRPIFETFIPSFEIIRMVVSAAGHWWLLLATFQFFSARSAMRNFLLACFGLGLASLFTLVIMICQNNQPMIVCGGY